MNPSSGNLVPLARAISRLASVEYENQLALGDHTDIVAVVGVLGDRGPRRIAGEEDVAAFGSQHSRLEWSLERW